MSPPGKYTLRLVICGVAIAYLTGDFFVFNGPLRQATRRATHHGQEVVARVSGSEISRSQLERAIDEQLWLEGKTAKSLTPAELKVIRATALDELIDHELLRSEIKAEVDRPAVSQQEIDGRVRRLASQFENQGALETAMKSQGIGSGQDLRDRIAARVQQENFIARHIGPASKVTEADARKWFDENQLAIAFPERVEARHIFIPTLDHPPEEAKRKLDDALVRLTEKKQDFATLAKELSEDPATKDSGGALGWMTRERLPADFSAPLFPLEMNKPALVRTKLGWHLVEVTARKPAGPCAFDQAKAEIISALETTRRRQAAADFRKSLRNRNSSRIEILPAATAN